MPIQVNCPQCQKTYTFPDDKRGKQVRCRDCFQNLLRRRRPGRRIPGGRGAAGTSADPEAGLQSSP